MTRLAWLLLPSALVACAMFALEAWLVTRPLPPTPEFPEVAVPEAPAPNLTRVAEVVYPRRVAEPAPKAKLLPAPPPRARLLGTLVSCEAPSLASFAPERGNSFTMTVGELLEGWELDDIAQGRVRLHRGDEKLELTTGGVATVDSSARMSWATPPTVSFNRAQLDGLIAQYSKQVMTTTQLVPRYAGGQLQGLSISFPPDSPLSQLGFRPSDLIVSTDGVPITPERLAELSLDWKQRRSIDVGVKRGDRIETLRWTVD